MEQKHRKKERRKIFGDKECDEKDRDWVFFQDGRFVRLNEKAPPPSRTGRSGMSLAVCPFPLFLHLLLFLFFNSLLPSFHPTFLPFFSFLSTTTTIPLTSSGWREGRSGKSMPVGHVVTSQTLEWPRSKRPSSQGGGNHGTEARSLPFELFAAESLTLCVCVCFVEDSFRIHTRSYFFTAVALHSIHTHTRF